MSKLEVYEKSKAQSLVEGIYSELEQRIQVSALASCPVELTAAFVKMAAAQSCGKCTPCRIGLAQLAKLLDKVLDGQADLGTLALIEETAQSIYYSADCAVGYEAAAVTVKAVKGFTDDFRYHIEHNDCASDSFAAVPCVAGCPASVDIPGYIALTAAGRYADAVRLVRKDNPFAIVCGMICEHPCELYCRRGMVDDPLNIRGLKRFATDHMQNVEPPTKAAASGKRVAVVGGGPAGLTAAHYLALMGHSTVVYEQCSKLGGMLRYGIPAYRLPRESLDSEIAYLLAPGVEVKTGTSVGKDITLAALRQEFDAVYLSIGAHAENTLGIDGEAAEGVMSAVQLLRSIGDDEKPDFTAKTVCVVGGGNVAMDVARTALRLGAAKVVIAYRRRRLDMTAQDAEIEAAVAEGCELLELHAPLSIEAKGGKVCGIKLQPQMISVIEAGRAKPKNAAAAPVIVACDLVLVAIGQSIDTAALASVGVTVERGRISAADNSSLANLDGVFAGGDCVTGPATAIRAVAAGKAAARNIDDFFGFDHKITLDVEIPAALFRSRVYCARSNMGEHVPDNLCGNFDLVENGLLEEEAVQESSRCLRCDHFGLGVFRGGRELSW
ncbi:MAG: NAD(P)-binding protein [Actinomycetia bacterium]|nr:NAD(P)-binding protein [Actinomycetes bacterium]